MANKAILNGPEFDRDNAKVFTVLRMLFWLDPQTGMSFQSTLVDEMDKKHFLDSGQGNIDKGQLFQCDGLYSYLW